MAGPPASERYRVQAPAADAAPNNAAPRAHQPSLDRDTSTVCLAGQRVTDRTSSDAFSDDLPTRKDTMPNVPGHASTSCESIFFCCCHAETF